MELKLASSIAWDTWRLDRLRAIENKSFVIGTQDPGNDCIVCHDAEIHTAMSNALTFGRKPHRIALLSLYEQRLTKAVHNNLAVLRSLQAERRRNRDADDEREEIILARSCNVNGLAYQAPAWPTENGSVFSNEEILSAVNRETALKVASVALAKAPWEVKYREVTENNGPDRPNSGPNPGLQVMQTA